jgi:hypothetical protein
MNFVRNILQKSINSDNNNNNICTHIDAQMKKARILITPYDLERKTANISLPVLVPKIGNNLGSKDLDILKVTLSPESNDKVVCPSFDKAL